jgi:hypothetical protein
VTERAWREDAGPTVASASRFPSGGDQRAASQESARGVRRRPGPWLVGVERFPFNRIADDHDSSVERAVEQFMSRSRPRRKHTTAGRDLPLAPRTRERPDVDVVLPRLVRLIGQPPAVGRKSRCALVEVAAQKGSRLSRRPPRRLVASIASSITLKWTSVPQRRGPSRSDATSQACWLSLVVNRLSPEPSARCQYRLKVRRPVARLCEANAMRRPSGVHGVWLCELDVVSRAIAPGQSATQMSAGCRPRANATVPIRRDADCPVEDADCRRRPFRSGLSIRLVWCGCRPVQGCRPACPRSHREQPCSGVVLVEIVDHRNVSSSLEVPRSSPRRRASRCAGEQMSAGHVLPK